MRKMFTTTLNKYIFLYNAIIKNKCILYKNKWQNKPVQPGVRPKPKQ